MVLVPGAGVALHAEHPGPPGLVLEVGPVGAAAVRPVYRDPGRPARTIAQ